MPRTKKQNQPMAQPPVIYSQPNNNILYVMMGVITLFLIFMTVKMFSLEKKVASGTTTGGSGVTTAAQQAPPPTTISLNKIKPLFSSGYMFFGDAKRKLLFVEVSDPSCPYCQVAGGQNPELSKQMGSNFQYNTDGGTYDPPVTEIHKLVDEGKASYVQIYAPGHGSGQLGAQALYCAYEKDKFWEVHDKLMSFDGYNLLNDTVKNDLANLPKLVDFLSGTIDANFLQSCVQSGKYAKTLERDFKLAQSIGYQGTPEFIVNTTIYPGAVSFSNMKSEVDKNL